MKMRTSLLALLAATMFIASANAHVTTTSSGAPSEVVVGETYSVDWTASANCGVIGPEQVTVPGEVPEVGGTSFPEYVYGESLTFGIANGGDYSWLVATQEDQVFEESKCTDPANQGSHPFSGNVSFSVNATAPAFETFTFQPGAFGENNDGGAFDVTIAYNPAFTAPTALSFDAVGGTATATIPLTMAANADSVFDFDVTSFTFDGEEAPEGAMAHIQETKEVATGIATEEGVTATTVDLHFSVSGEHDAMDDMDHGEDSMDDMDHGDDAMGHDDPEAADGGHFHWETAQAVVSITLASKDDATQESDAKLVALTFTNTDTDTMPHGDEHTDTDSTGEDGFFKSLPGFGPIGVIAAIGAVAALRRRN